ncbi:hypothetical protein JCM6882_003228 [Rhodosporidiobolus microsporus]
MPPPKQAETPPTLPLPVVSLSASTLRLSFANAAATKLLSLPTDAVTAPTVSAASFLRRGGEGEGGVDEARVQLEGLVKRSGELEWGESVVLEYYTPEEGTGERRAKKAEVVVSFTPPAAPDDSADSAGTYTIVFLRPATLSLSTLVPLTLASDAASIPSPATTISIASSVEPSYPPVFSPASSTSSLIPPPASAVFSSNSPPSTHVSTLTNAGLVRTAASFAHNTTIPSGSSGSGGSSGSSSSRRPQRTPTGQDRRNLPVAPEVAQMLSHATNPIREKSSSAGLSSLSPVPSSPDSAFAGDGPTSPPPIAPSASLLASSPATASSASAPSGRSSPSHLRPLPPSAASTSASSETSLSHPSPAATRPRTNSSSSSSNARRSSFDYRYDTLMHKTNLSVSQPERFYRLPDSEDEARQGASPASAPRLPARITPSTPLSSGEPPPPQEDYDRPIVKEAAELLAGKRRERRGSAAFTADDDASEPVGAPAPALGSEIAAANETPAAEEPAPSAAEEAAPSPAAERAEVPSEAVAAEPEKGRRLPLGFESMKACIETVPQIIFIADPDGQVLWLNKSWYTYTGQDPDYLLNEQEWVSCFHPDDLPSAFGVYLGAMKTGNDFFFEYRVKGADGKLRWHVCQGRAYRDSQTGDIQNWFCTVTNIDELVSTRHDALLIKERTQAVLKGSELALVTVDSAGRVTLCEGRRPSLLPDDRDPLTPIVGAEFSEIWPDGELNEAVRQVLDEEREVVELETQAVDRDGSRHFNRYRLVPLRGDPSIPSSHPDATAVTGVIIVGRDVTKLVMAEDELQRSRTEKAQLEASEIAAKEASRLKTEFLTSVSHEIRTPISQILGICELLLEGDGTTSAQKLHPEHRNLVEKAVRSGENLLELVGAVLDVRKVETGELVLEAAPFLLNEALSDARLYSVIAQKKGLDFVEDIGAFYEGTLLGDRLRLRQILANGIGNATKFTSRGSIALRLRQLSESDASITVEFVIEDSGIGIDKDVLPTLFVPFRQADASTARQFGGSGLGLTIAKKLVELMGGSISLTSPGSGLGARMTITVPLAKAPLLDVRDFVGTPHLVRAATQAQAEDIQRQDESVEEVRKRRRPEEVRILLSEDNDLIREILIRTLRGRKFQIDAVEDGRQCLEQIEKQRYDVLLMDGQMPNMDGYEATKAIRQHPDARIRALRIIALTASAIAGDKERCLASGMSSYLSKPVRAKELEAAIWQQVEFAELNTPADQTIPASLPSLTPPISPTSTTAPIHDGAPNSSALPAPPTSSSSAA